LLPINRQYFTWWFTGRLFCHSQVARRIVQQHVTDFGILQPATLALFQYLLRCFRQVDVRRSQWLCDYCGVGCSHDVLECSQHRITLCGEATSLMLGKGDCLQVEVNFPS